MSPDWIFAAGAVTAVAAAARSTWSPCGLSMLSSITPFGERSRGHRYGATATWFVLGAVVGGLSLGGASAILALCVSDAGLPDRPAAVAVIAASFALAAAVADAGAFGEWLPIIRRQVDDAWLSRYRPWFYGAGFGWQIGVGVATYVMTAAVFLLIVLAALTADPAAAVVLGGLFGLARGLTVFLTSRARTPRALRELHRLLDRIGPSVRRMVITVELAVATVALAERWLVPGIIVGASAGVVTLVWSAHRRLPHTTVPGSAQVIEG
jgi:hypothetical protein